MQFRSEIFFIRGAVGYRQREINRSCAFYTCVIKFVSKYKEVNITARFIIHDRLVLLVETWCDQFVQRAR